MRYLIDPIKVLSHPPGGFDVMSPHETFVFYETTDLRSVPAPFVTSQRACCQSWLEGQTFPISWEFFDTIVIYVNKADDDHANDNDDDDDDDDS